MDVGDAGGVSLLHRQQIVADRGQDVVIISQNPGEEIVESGDGEGGVAQFDGDVIGKSAGHGVMG